MATYKNIFGMTFKELKVLSPDEFADLFGEKYRSLSVSKLRKTIDNESKAYKRSLKDPEVRKRHPTLMTLGTILQKFNNARYRCSARFKHRTAKHYYGKGIKYLLTRDEGLFIFFRDQAYLMINPSIDRINPDGNYELSNCRFVEAKCNSRRRKTA